MKLKAWHIALVLVLLAGILARCGTAATASTNRATSEIETSALSAQSEGSEASTSTALDDSYENALPVSSQLALGTFLLEGTKNTVTTEQAQTLLPLWQIVQSGALQGESETEAVLKQIEGAMTAEQLAAIGAMQLTSDDMGAWAQEQGVTLGAPGGGAEGFSLPEGMTEEQMEEMRAARKSGEGGFAPEGVTQEDREAMRATAEANGMTRPEGAGGMGAGQLAALAGPLVELLAELASG